jgi:Family of unknown function (DUF6286)
VILVLRALVRVVSFVLLVALALLGLAAAVSAIAPDSAADLLGLPALRDSAGGWLDALEHGGAGQTASALAGAGAMLLGLLLLIGVLIPRRERLVALRKTEHGTLGARRRALAAVAQALTEQARGVTAAKVKVRPRRRGGGRLKVRADRPRPTEARAVEHDVEEELRTLTGPFRLKASVKSRVGDRGARVQ